MPLATGTHGVGNICGANVGILVRQSCGSLTLTLHSVSALARSAAGDEIELFAIQQSGGNLATAVAAGTAPT